MQLPIYFFGDNHFSPTPSLSNERKIKKMEEFIHVIEKSKGSIFIMGDFFDYYFEYKKNNPNYFEKIFLLLEKIKSKGIEIYFIAGRFDLRPKARKTPIGKQKIIAKAEIIKVSDSPPQAAVST